MQSEMIRYLTKKFSNHTITEVKPVGDRTFTIHGYSPHPADVETPKPEPSRCEKRCDKRDSSSEDEEISEINNICEEPQGSPALTRPSPTRPVLTRPTPTRPDARHSPPTKERQSPVKEIRQSPQHFKDLRQSPKPSQAEFPLKICPVPLNSSKNRLTPPLKQFEMKLPGLQHRPHKPETQRPEGQRSIPRFETIRQRNKQSTYLSNSSIPQIRHKQSAFSETYPSIEGIGIKPHVNKVTNKRVNTKPSSNPLSSKPQKQHDLHQPQAIAPSQCKYSPIPQQPIAPTQCKYSPKLKEKFISHMGEKQKDSKSSSSSPPTGKCSPTQIKMIVRERTPSPTLDDLVLHYMKPQHQQHRSTPPRTPSPKYMDDSGYQTPTSCFLDTSTSSGEFSNQMINPDYSEPGFENKRPLSPISNAEGVKCYSAPPDTVRRERSDTSESMGSIEDERRAYHQKRLSISNDLKRKYSVVPVDHDEEVRSICGTAFTTAFLLTASQSSVNQKTIDISVLRPNKRVCCTDGNSPPSARRPSINVEKMAQTVLIRRPLVRKAGHGQSFKVWSTKETRKPAFRTIPEPTIQPEYSQQPITTQYSQHASGT